MAKTLAIEPEARQRKPLQRSLRVKRRQEASVAFLFLLPNLIGFLIFSAIPIIAAFIISFYDWDLLLGANFIGLDNYKQLLTDNVFRAALLNTLYFVVVSVPLAIVIGLGVALLTNQSLPGMNIYRAIFLLPYVTLTVAIALAWKWLYLPGTGLVNQLLALVGIHGPNWLTSPIWAMPALVILSVWKSFGYNMVLFLAGLQNIPQHLYEAAIMDGATPWQRFRHVTFPLLSPVTFFVVVITTIGSFQVFDQALVMTQGGPGLATTTLVMNIYQVGFQSFHMGYASAIAWVLFAIVFVCTLIQFWFQRRLVSYD
ncbi:sugar ABC transporter permease [Reticulibacter mediterranei]|uniref:Sugar ABC transporter permease n=1 Tax=Reticulibacter mediterranei TaxID=2778369 RepID=A0A8J3IXC0_9CHLR|nr:sugar ABC transporter permease [Reticulibacter mediterranei]GHP00214.1 sugar ABC transporter permease [Reticulibacter mediterranei]